MRAVFVGISVLLITGCGLAQTDMRTQSIQNLGVLSPQREFAMDQLPPIVLDPSPRQRADTAKNENENELPDVNDQGRCYSIRAYLFSQGTASSAPQQTDYTTCVRSNSLQLRQARPVLKFLPQ
jgi:hypothetical protein